MITERIAKQTLMSRIERRRSRKSTSNATDFVIFDRFCPKPLFQSEAKCETIDMKMSFHSHANKTLSNEKGFTLSIALKVRIFGTIIIFFHGDTSWWLSKRSTLDISLNRRYEDVETWKRKKRKNTHFHLTISESFSLKLKRLFNNTNKFCWGM